MTKSKLKDEQDKLERILENLNLDTTKKELRNYRFSKWAIKKKQKEMLSEKQY